MILRSGSTSGAKSPRCLTDRINPGVPLARPASATAQEMARTGRFSGKVVDQEGAAIAGADVGEGRYPSPWRELLSGLDPFIQPADTSPYCPDDAVRTPAIVLSPSATKLPRTVTHRSSSLTSAASEPRA
jgi:hypothetical protein